MTTLTATSEITTATHVETYAHDPRVTVEARNGAPFAVCSCCGRGGEVDGPLAKRFTPKSHGRFCDLAGEETVAFRARRPVAAETSAPVADARPIRVAGHEFETEDDVVMAVRCGGISMGAAMNRDTD